MVPSSPSAWTKGGCWTLVFKLVDNTSVQSLLLEDNYIDGATLGRSLEALIPDVSGTSCNLSNIRNLSLAGNNIGSRTQADNKIRFFKDFHSRRTGDSLSTDYRDVFESMRHAFPWGILGSLRRISFSRSAICSKDMQKLGACLISLPNLEEVDISHNDLHGGGIAALCEFDWLRLRILSLRKTHITANDCISIANAIRAGKLKALEIIDLGENVLGDEGMCALTLSFQRAFLPKLQEILLENTGISDREVDAILERMATDDLHTLRSVAVSSNPRVSWLSSASLDARCQNPLRDSYRGPICWEDASIIKAAKRIESGLFRSRNIWNISNATNVTEESWASLLAAFRKENAINLRELHLANAGLSNGTIRKLTKVIKAGIFERLEVLNLDNNRNIGDESLRFRLAAFHKGHAINLRKLCLAHTALGIGSIGKLAKAIRSDNLSSLEELDISHPSSPKYLFRSITNLFSGSREGSMVLLAASFGTGHTTRLQKLNLRATGLGKEGAVKLLEAIESFKLSSLKELDLQDNPATSKDHDMSLLKISSLHSPVPGIWKGDFNYELEEHEIWTEEHEVRMEEHEIRMEEHEIRMEEHEIRMKAIRMEEHKIFLEAVRMEAIAKRKAKEEVVDKSEKQYNSDSVSLSDFEDNSVDVGEGKAKEQAMDKSLLGLLFRSDVQCLGFECLNQDFNPRSILVLGDVSFSKQQGQFIFFHVEVMLSLFGVGLPYSIVSMSLIKQEIWIEEITKEEWNTFWTSDNGVFTPFLFERTENDVQEESKLLQSDVHWVGKDTALKSISADGPELQVFVKVSGDTSLGTGGKVDWIPSWKRWLKSVMNHADSNGTVPSGTTTHGLQHQKQASSSQSSGGTPTADKGKTFDDQSAQGATTTLEHKPQAASPTGQEEKLVIIITFRCPDFSFVRNSPNRQSRDVVRVDHDNILHGRKSLIRPALKVEFFREAGENKLKTLLEVNYEMEDQGVEWASGWFQNYMDISFYGKECEFTEQVTSSIKGVKQIPVEFSRAFEEMESRQNGGSHERAGQLQTLPGGIGIGASFNIKNSRQEGGASQSKESEQRKESRITTVLADYPSFGVVNYCGEAVVHYATWYLPTPDPGAFDEIHMREAFPNSGLQSLVDIQVEGTWELEGTSTHEYLLEASKVLTRCTHTSKKIDGTQLRIGDSRGESSTSSTSQDATIPAQMHQMFNKNLFVNHNFSDFFDQCKRPEAYKWKIRNQAYRSSDVSPAPDAFTIKSFRNPDMSSAPDVTDKKL